MNKVETMVEGYWDIDESLQYSEDEKSRLKLKLEKKITTEGLLLVKSQVHRSQLENKQEVIDKMNQLIISALKEPKKRKPTKPSKASQEKRVENKIKAGILKQERKKIRYD